MFVGKVEKTSNDRFGYSSLAAVRVQQVWKGRAFLSRPIVHIDGSGGPTYPARVFWQGQAYLFYLPAPNPAGAFRADSYLHQDRRDALFAATGFSSHTAR